MASSSATSPDFCTDQNASLAGRSLWETAFVLCPQLSFTVPVLVAFQLTLVFLFAYIRKYAMKRMGIAPEDIEAILSSRRNGAVSSKRHSLPDATDIAFSLNDPSQKDNLEVDQENPASTDQKGGESDNNTGVPVFHLPTLVRKYGDRKLRLLDSLPRKTVHFLLIGGTMLLLQLTTSTFVSQGQTTILSVVFVTVLLISSHSWVPDSWLAIHLFGSASRIRDGSMGRANLVTSLVVSSVGSVVTYIIGFKYIVPNLADPSFQMLLFVLYYTPVAVGDALGELIGGPFGGTFFPTFRVMGFGEINRKSVEGCFAVFAGSLLGDIVMCQLYGARTSSWVVLSLIIAIVTTIVETAAFRSTDNFFIPVCNCLVVLLALGPFGEQFAQLQLEHN